MLVDDSSTDGSLEAAEQLARIDSRITLVLLKQGFSLPIHQWLRHQGRRPLMTLLAPNRIDALKDLHVSTIGRAVQAHMPDARALGWELWGLTVLVGRHEQRLSRPLEAHGGQDTTDLRRVSAPAGTRIRSVP